LFVPLFLEPQYFFTFHTEIFREAIFDVELFAGYQKRKFALQQMFHFFDFYTLMDSIEKFSEYYKSQIQNIGRDVRRLIYKKLERLKEELKLQMSKCQNFEINEKSTLGLALAKRCVLDVYCRMNNFYIEVQVIGELKGMGTIEGNQPYYTLKECEQMISFC